MENDDKAANGKSHSLMRAKRMFLVNSALFFCLVITAAILYVSGEEEKPTESDTATPAPEKVWSLPELAYLKGEMQALSERPETMPEYEEEWVRNIAEQAVLRDPHFEGQSMSRILALSEQYFKGYTARFDEYYDTQPAREFGYRYGVKFNPELHGWLPPKCDRLLFSNRDKLEKKFEIQDEVTWRLFCDAFDSGYAEGFRVIEEGITVHSPWEKILLFED